VFVGVLLGVLGTPGHGRVAHAHGTGTPTPADGEVLRGTPERIIVELPGDGPVTLELRDADGEAIAFTGEIERAPGVVRALPPVLEHGTYILEWSSANGDGWSTFSVGKPDALITGVGEDPRPGGALAGAVMVLLLGLGVARAAARAGSTRRIALWSIAGIATTGSSALLAPPTSVGGAISFLLLAVGGAGGLITLAGSAKNREDSPADDTVEVRGTDSTKRYRGGAELAGRTRGNALTITGLALLPAYAAAGIVRNSTANPFSVASLLAIVASILLVVVVLPLVSTGMFARRRGERRPATAGMATLGAFLVIASLSNALGVETRIDTITEETRPAASCLSGTNRLQIQRCLDASLVATARGESVVAALDTLKRLLGSENKARFFCHEASHAIGRESLRMNGNLADAFRDGYDVCDFGYYHGIVEGAAAGFDDATFMDAVPTLCEEFASAEELFYMQCNHGIGHAAARRTNNDMVRSLEFCDALSLNPNLTGERLRIAANGCGTGVTMEWFATATADPNAAVTPKVTRPRDVCLSIPERWVPECIEYVGNTLDASAPVESLRELGQWCSTTGYAEPCYRGLARAAAGVGIPARDAIGVCDAAGTEGARDECVRFYIAAVATTIEYDVSAVDRICRELPEADRSGPTSLCEQVRVAVVEVLAAGDGK